MGGRTFTALAGMRSRKVAWARRPCYARNMNLDGIISRIADLEMVPDLTQEPFELPVPGLNELLDRHEGFYALNRSLHVLGRVREPRFHSIFLWNDPQGWISEYGDLAEGLLFFAENAFGDQFAFDGERIVRFDAETGARTGIAETVEQWLAILLDDPDRYLESAGIAAWTQRNGLIPFGKHLAPDVPFVLSSGMDNRNNKISLVDPFQSMGFKGTIARQIKDLPDGAQIKIDWT